LPGASLKNTGSTPGDSKAFKPQWCGLTSISVIAGEWFKFEKRSQLFLGTSNKTLSVVAVSH
jgi:hypothetical protein